MIIRLCCICCFIALTVCSAYSENSVTYYRDGALYRQTVAANNGIINMPLPVGILEQTLTITPVQGSTILTVQTDTNVTTVNSKNLDALIEQKLRLEDRLQALETRENIFTAAAKTQSGKAPRKTKNNPEPLQNIRQGTDFAIAQLEAVYTAKRKAIQEIKKLEARIAAANRNAKQANSSVKIMVTPKHGRVLLRYATSNNCWQPEYNLYLTNGKSDARLQLSAKSIQETSGFKIYVAKGLLNESGKTENFPVQSGSAVISNYLLPFDEESSISGIFNRFKGTITNSTSTYLPPGDTLFFRDGSYLGKFRFEGVSSGRKKIITLGF